MILLWEEDKMYWESGKLVVALTTKKGEIHFNIGAFKGNSRGLFCLEGILRVGECMLCVYACLG